MKFKKLLSAIVLGAVLIAAPLALCKEEAKAEGEVEELNQILLQEYALWQNNDYVGMYSLDTSDVTRAYADQIRSSGADRYICDIDGTTKAMMYVSEGGGYWWYFGEMANGLRQGAGTTVVLGSNYYYVFTGVYAADFPAGNGTLVLNQNDWGTYSLSGNFQGTLLNGSYEFSFYDYEYGDAPTITLPYANGHLQSFDYDWIYYSVEGNALDGAYYVYSYVDGNDSAYLLNLDEGYEPLVIMVYPEVESVSWDSVPTANPTKDIFKGSGNGVAASAVTAPEVTAAAETETPEVAAEPETPAEPVYAGGTYVTVRGDNLCKIAKKLYGDEKGWIDIYNANADVIGEGYMIWANQTLIIPSR